MTVVVTEGEDSGPDDNVVALAAVTGQAVAEVEQLSTETAEATATAEGAIAVAESARELSIESLTIVEQLLETNRAILAGQDEIKTAIVVMANTVSELLPNEDEEQEEEPEPPKPDTAPKRKHWLYR